MRINGRMSSRQTFYEYLYSKTYLNKDDMQRYISYPKGDEEYNLPYQFVINHLMVEIDRLKRKYNNGK